MDSCYITQSISLWLVTLMLIEPLIMVMGGRHGDTVYTLVTLWFHGIQENKGPKCYLEEFRTLALIVCKVVWIQKVLATLNVDVSDAIVISCDNISANYLAKHLVYYVRTKKRLFHIEHTPMQKQIAYIITKALDSAIFFEMRTKLPIIQEIWA